MDEEPRCRTCGEPEWHELHTDWADHEYVPPDD